jgi:hypothetical protein
MHFGASMHFGALMLCGVTKGKQAEGNTLHCTIWNENPNFLPNVLSTKQIASQFSQLRSLKNLTQDSNLSAVYSSIITHSRSELLTVPSWHPFIWDKTCLVQTHTENFLQINMICMQRLSGGDQGRVSTDRHWWSSDQVDSPVGKFQLLCFRPSLIFVFVNIYAIP